MMSTMCGNLQEGQKNTNIIQFSGHPGNSSVREIAEVIGLGVALWIPISLRTGCSLREHFRRTGFSQFINLGIDYLAIS
jgi:hypothetical protein